MGFLRRQIKKLTGLSQVVVKQIEQFKRQDYSSAVDITGLDEHIRPVFRGLADLGQVLSQADHERQSMSEQLSQCANELHGSMDDLTLNINQQGTVIEQAGSSVKQMVHQADEVVSSARDLALLARAVMARPRIMEDARRETFAFTSLEGRVSQRMELGAKGDMAEFMSMEHLHATLQAATGWLELGLADEALLELNELPAETQKKRHVLELKLALIRRGDFGDLFEFFGIGSHERYKAVYRSIRSGLPASAHSAAIELARRNRQALCVVLHPGTVDTALSQPFAKTGLDVRPPAVAAQELLQVMDTLPEGSNGGYFDHHGKTIPW